MAKLCEPLGLDDFYPFPPYNSMGEAIQGFFETVGIRTRQRTMERAAYFS